MARHQLLVAPGHRATASVDPWLWLLPSLSLWLTTWHYFLLQTPILTHDATVIYISLAESLKGASAAQSHPRQEPKGRYHCTTSMATAPIRLWTEHLIPEQRQHPPAPTRSHDGGIVGLNVNLNWRASETNHEMVWKAIVCLKCNTTSRRIGRRIRHSKRRYITAMIIIIMVITKSIIVTNYMTLVSDCKLQSWPTMPPSYISLAESPKGASTAQSHPRQEPKGRYHCTTSMATAPIRLWTEHLIPEQRNCVSQHLEPIIWVVYMYIFTVLHARV